MIVSVLQLTCVMLGLCKITARRTITICGVYATCLTVHLSLFNLRWHFNCLAVCVHELYWSLTRPVIWEGGGGLEGRTSLQLTIKKSGGMPPAPPNLHFPFAQRQISIQAVFYRGSNYLQKYHSNLKFNPPPP